MFVKTYRLAGATLLAPVVNYWWPGFPANLSKEAYYQQLPSDQWAVRIAHYIPWLTYWWNTQKWFPCSAVIDRNPAIFSRQDKQLYSSRPPGGALEVFNVQLFETSPPLPFCVKYISKSRCQG